MDIQFYIMIILFAWPMAYVIVSIAKRYKKKKTVHNKVKSSRVQLMDYVNKNPL